MKRAGLVLAIAALFFASMPVSTTHGQGGGADFTRFVGVGDSLTAGFKDGALYADAQSEGYYALLAEAFGSQVSIPTIAYPGIPTPNPSAGQGLLLQIPGTCQVGATVFAEGQTTGRVNPTAPATNVAIPGQDMGDALTKRWSIDPANPVGTADSLEDFILGFPYAFLPAPANTPRSQVETAVGLQPTFVVLFLGSNDALGAALAATVNDETLTPVPEFNDNADAVFAAIASTGAKAVVINVPDVGVIPNLFSSADLQALTGLDAAQVKLLFGVAKTSYVPLSALPTVLAIGNGQLPPGSLTANQILTKKELKKIRKNIQKYNQKVQALANANGWAFVDINTIITGYDRNGVTIPGFGTLTTAYLGGIFGLDGVHPSATGHALLASAIIDAVNAKYGTNVAKPNVAAIAATDPQTCGAVTGNRPTLQEIVHVSGAARSAESIIVGNRLNR